MSDGRPGDSAAAPAPPPPSSWNRSTAPAPAQPADPPRIQVGELASPADAPIGALSPLQGAFGRDIWRGSGPADLVSLFDALGGGTASGTLQNLQRRLLMTPAEPPQGVPPEQFLAWRVGSLLIDGAAADALALARAVPPSAPPDQALQRLTADAAWLDLDPQTACDTARSASQGVATPYWEKASLLCQIAAGDWDLAALTANSIAEVSNLPDSFILAARQVLNAGPPVPGAKARPTVPAGLAPGPLTIALLDLTQSRPPDGFTDGANPAELAAIARLPQAPLAMQRQAAEGAVGFGTLPPAALAGLWLAAAEAGGPAATPPALSYRSLDAEVRDPSLAAIDEDRVEALLLAGRTAGLTAATARAAAPLLARLPPDSLSGRIAADVMRTFLRAGDIDEALSWWQRLKARRSSRDATAATASLWPLLYLAAPDGYLPWSDDAFDAWSATLADLPFAVQQERERSFLVLADAAGRRVPPALQDRLPPASATPAGPVALSSDLATDPARRRAVLQQFDEAVAGRRQGEAMLAALALLHPAGPADAELALVAHVAAGLRILELPAEARGIALEAALAAGL